MNTKMVYGIVAAVILVLVVWLIASQGSQDQGSEVSLKAPTSDDAMMKKDDAMMEDSSAEDAMMKKDDSMMEASGANDAMMKKDDTMMEAVDPAVKDEMMMVGVGSYEPYAASKIAMAKSGTVVLFFKANWCPSCLAVDKDIKASLQDIPAGITILETDYDKESELKKKYNVVTQHTFVQVDENGEEITKWVGANTLEEVVNNLK